MGTIMKTSTRSLWLAYVLLLGLILGAAGGLLDWASGDSAAKAVIAGGATFTAAVTLAILILSFAGASSEE
jgi:hypothetical protein